MALHEPIRSWRTMWQLRCLCGARRWPCPDTHVEPQRPASHWLTDLPLERIRDMHREGPPS